MGWRDTTLTIADSGTESAELNLTENSARRRKVLAIRAPNHGVTVTVHAKVGGTFQPYQQVAGTDLVLPAEKVTVITDLVASAIKLVAGSAVSGNQVFAVEGTAVE